ncbi:hypothetical protein ACFY2Z_27080 [Streptomyces sp. NPDC001222]|uniref:hypothetical protein n=1 Tax=Streptomyces sp. NPDC001222 TaxID=3364548 RepID=UPI0036886D3F
MNSLPARAGMVAAAAELLDRLLLSGDDYRKRLRSVLPAYTEQAGDFVGVLRTAVHR